MNNTVRDLWNKFKNGLLDSSVLNESTNVTNEIIPKEVSDLLTLNNGQNLSENGIFKLIRNGTGIDKWEKYKFIEEAKIIELFNKIYSSKKTKYSDEVPFAITTKFENGNVCLTINKNNKEISIVTFGLTPENYDLREVSNYVQDKNKISKDIDDFLKTQIMFNEME